MHDNLAKGYEPGKELVQSEAFASKVLEAALNGIYVYDLTQGRHVFVNSRYTRLTGYTLEDLQPLDRTRFFALFHPDDHPRMAAHMQRIQNGGDPAQIEYRFKTKAGHWIWCLSFDSAFTRTPQGTVTQFIGSFIDVTIRKNAEQALIRSERLYRHLATNFPNGAVFVVDHELRYLLAAGQGLKSIGLTPSQLEGRSLFEILGKTAAAQFESYLRKALNGKPFRMEHVNFDRYYISHGMPLRDAKGKVYAALIVSNDITERKASEKNWLNAVETSQALNRLHETLHSTLEIDEIIQRIVTTGSMLLGSDSAAVSLRVDDGWIVQHVYGMSPSLVGLRMKDDEEQHAVLAITAGRVVTVDDAFRDGLVNTEHMRRHSIRSVMVAPLVVRNEAIGVIFFNYHSAQHHFTETEINFARQMAFIAGIALANAKLYEAQKSAEDQVRRVNRELEQRVAERTAEIEKQYKTLEKLNALIKQLSRKTIAAIENDRKALSKEIHDKIGGSLSAIKMMLETDANRSRPSSNRTDREIIRHLADTIKETKRISFQMRSLALDEFGLQAAISENIKIFKSFYPNIAVDFKADISPNKLPEEITLVIYRVVQEGLNSIGKQTGASQVNIVLSELEEHIYIQIEDDGRGFVEEPIACRETISHWGIHSIKERVEICGGTFQMDSIPGRGTRLKAFIPKKF